MGGSREREEKKQQRSSGKSKDGPEKRRNTGSLCERIRGFRSKQSTMGCEIKMSTSSTYSDSSSRSRSRSQEKESKTTKGFFSSGSDEANPRAKRDSDDGEGEIEKRTWGVSPLKDWIKPFEDSKKVTSSGKTIAELRMEREVRMVIEREKTARLLRQQIEAQNALNNDI